MEKKLLRLRSAPEARLCYAGFVFIDERGAEVEKPPIRYEEGTEFCEALARFNILLSPSCVLISRRCFEQVGGFNTDSALFHCEDYDVWLRIALSGWPVVAVPENCRNGEGILTPGLTSLRKGDPSSASR